MKWFAVFFSITTMLQPLRGENRFSGENALRHLRTLSVEIGPRPMGSPAERRALEYAVAQFREHGCDTAYIMEVPYSARANTASGVAVGIHRGATGRMIVIGGHIDSAAPEFPGADDDGSGTAIVLELSRVLCARQTQSTYAFCCWGGEEQGLIGSKYFVDHFEELDSVALMLQIDMANGDGLIELDPDTHGASAPQWLTRAAIEEFYSLGYSHLRYPTHFFSLNYAPKEGSGSDHEPFLRKGIPAIDFTTDVGNPIHTPRDNFENFDSKGLQRSGDVILRLAERFDNGTPSRATENYWLFLVGRIPIFFPLGVIWFFAGLTLLLAIMAFVSVRRRREPPDAPGRIRWSGIKMFLFTLVVVLCGWFSSDLIGLLKGLRHPWMTAIPSYSLLAVTASGIGIWLIARWSKHLRLSSCPYVFAKRAMIGLLIFTLGLGMFSVKLLVEPAAALFFLSLAILVRNAFLKLVFACLAPVWMVRLVFSEWSPLLFRTTAMNLPGDFVASALFSGIMTLFFAIIFVPFFFSFAAVIRDSATLHMLIAPLRSRGTLAVLLVAFIALGGYCYTLPVYDRYWYTNVGIEQSYDMNKFSKEIRVTGGEYLKGLRIRGLAGDTMISANTTTARLWPEAPFDTTWLIVNRRIENVQRGDSLHRSIDLTLVMARRPFTVSVVHSGPKDNPVILETPWMYRSEKGISTLQWYSYPDSILRIPISFTTAGSDSVKERIEVTFDTLASPMRAERELTYVIPRTKYVQTYVYGK